MLVIVSAMFIENTLKIDDPVGASSVHGVCGAWGICRLGLFADGRYGDGWNGVPGPVRGLFYGDPAQLAAEWSASWPTSCGSASVTFVTLRIVEGHGGQPRLRAPTSWPAWTCRRWGWRGTAPSPCPIDDTKED